MKKCILLIATLVIASNCVMQAQAVFALHSDNESATPRLQWYSTSQLDSTNFTVYRSGMQKMDFKPISTIQGTFSRGDSLIFWVADTTLLEKALYKYFITLPFKHDTLIRSEILYGHNMGYYPSPQIINFNAESSVDRKAINLSWKLNYNFTVNTISLYRSAKYDDGYELVAQLPGNAEYYTNPVKTANEAYYYYFIIHDYFGYQRQSIRFHGIAKYKEKPLTPKNLELTTENKMIHLSWEKHGNNVVGYRVYRRIDKVGQFVPVTNLFYTPAKTVNFTDSTSTAIKNKNIEYYAVAVSDGFIESYPSDTLTYFKQGEIYKSPPEQCDFVLDSSNRIMLIWTSQDKDPDVKGYNVYKLKDGKKVKLNEKLLPYQVNYFVDKTNNGKTNCKYEIETISITNTASLNKTPVNVSKQYTTQHLILSLKKTEKGILIRAVPLTDKGIKEIILLKQIANSGTPEQITKLAPDNINFTDTNVKSGQLYSYSAIAVYADKSMEAVNSGVVIRY
jgi:hypothetical protein